MSGRPEHLGPHDDPFAHLRGPYGAGGGAWGGGDARDGAARGGVPDLTDAILKRVAAERPFACRNTRRMVRAARRALGVAAVLGVLGLAILYRAYPGVVGWTPRPAPLSEVVDSVRRDATSGVESVRQTIGTLRGAPLTAAVVAGDFTGDPEIPEVYSSVLASPVRAGVAEMVGPPQPILTALADAPEPAPSFVSRSTAGLVSSFTDGPRKAPFMYVSASGTGGPRRVREAGPATPLGDGEASLFSDHGSGATVLPR